MVKVITYGTYDMLHYGHILLLERAKALGDYLIVGITSDDYDKSRGKINNQQSLTERVEAIRATGLADQIIVEEYEGQKIDDIRKYHVDIFTIGSDWVGKFDYLNEYCKVVYLPRTEGISSSEIRTKERKLKIGFYGNNESRILNKYCSECGYVNGAEISGICSKDADVLDTHSEIHIFPNLEDLIAASDAIYIISHPKEHYFDIKKVLSAGKHVLVEMPVTLSAQETAELYQTAREKQVILMPAMKTAYATAYSRLILLAKSGKIGKIVSVDATCTSIRDIDIQKDYSGIWNSICAWGPTAMLPVFDLLGTNYNQISIASYFLDEIQKFDYFTKVDYVFRDAIASIKVGRGVKSEGELIISGTKGYIYVPAPWWKTDYFEIRYENPENNRRYYYQLEGEGIRYELVEFMRQIQTSERSAFISETTAIGISGVLEQYYQGNYTVIR